jgi:hypothetical protein
MLSNTLNTNEVKDNAGTEVEFTRLSTDGRTTEFAVIGEVPAYPKRLTIAHTESGAGVDKRRRSKVRFDISTVGSIDTSKTIQTSAYIVLDAPVGNISTDTQLRIALAYLMSFCASLGASTTILYDGTGNGAAALISGGL